MMEYPFDQSILMPDKKTAAIKGGADIYSTLLKLFAMPEAMKTQQQMSQAELLQKQLENKYYEQNQNKPLSTYGQAMYDRQNIADQYGKDSDVLKMFDTLLGSKQNQWQSDLGKTQADLRQTKKMFGEDSPEYKDALAQYNTKMDSIRAATDSRQSYANALPFMSQPQMAKLMIDQRLAELFHLTPEQWPQVTSNILQSQPAAMQSNNPAANYSPIPMTINPQQQQALQNSPPNVASQLGIASQSGAPTLTASPIPAGAPTPEQAADAQKASDQLGSYMDLKTSPAAIQKSKYAGRRAEQVIPYIQNEINQGALDYTGLQGHAKRGIAEMMSAVTGTTNPKLASYQRLKSYLNAQKDEMAIMMNVPADQQARGELDTLFNIDHLSKNPAAARAQLENLWSFMRSEEDVNFKSLQKLRKENESIANKSPEELLALYKNPKTGKTTGRMEKESGQPEKIAAEGEISPKASEIATSSNGIQHTFQNGKIYLKDPKTGKWISEDEINAGR